MNGSKNKGLGLRRMMWLLAPSIIMLSGFFHPHVATQAAERTDFIDAEIRNKVIRSADYTELPGSERTFQMPDYLTGNDWKKFFQYLSYTILILTLLLLIYFLAIDRYLMRTREKTKKPAPAFINVENFEEHIESANLEDLLQQALEEKRFHIAVRIRFLMLITFLSEKNLLSFRIDKTNRNYLNELKNTSHYNNFRKIVRIYERIWFGDVWVEQLDYMLISNAFDGFLSVFEDYEK